jgi:hypothetical protein
MIHLRVGSSGALPSSAYSADVRLHVALATHHGTIILRRLQASGSQFALWTCAQITRFLARDSFPHERPARRRTLVPAADPLRLVLREPNRPSPVLASSVACWCSIEPPVSTPLAPVFPKVHRRECHQARAVPFTCRLKHMELSTQNAFGGLDLALRRSRSLAPRFSVERFVTWTPFSLLSDDPPCQGVGPLPTAILSLPPTNLLPAHSRKMPLANLCSRLLLSRAPAGSPTPKLAACAVPPAATCLTPPPTLARE